MDQQKHPKKQNKGLQTAARFSGAAIQMGLTIYLGNWLGSYLDTTYNKAFWETSLTLFAVFMAMYILIKQAMNLNK